MSPLRAPAARLRARLAATSREDRLFAATFAVLAAVALVPIWRGRFLPLLDEPNHLSAIYIWHNIGDPATRLREFYELSIEPLPYLLHYGLAHLFAFVVGVEAANKLVISLYVLALPTAGLLWCRRTGRSPWLSVLTFPLAYSYAFAHGFHAFNLGLVSCLLGLVAVDAYLERPTVGRAVAVALLGIACYLGHPLPFFILGMVVLITWIVRRPPWRRTLATAAYLLPGLLLVVWQIVRPKQAVWGGGHGSFYQGVHLSPWEMLHRWPRYVLDTVSGDVDLAVLWVLLAVTALLLLVGLGRRLGRARREGWRAALHHERPLLDHRGLWLLLACTVCYFVVPIHLVRPYDWWYVSGRFGTFMCFFLFLLPATPLKGLRALLVLPAIVAAVVLPLHIAGKYAEFNRRAEPLVRMVAETRPGSNILALSMMPRGDPAVFAHAYNQLPAMVQVLHGGYNPGNWERPVPFPYKVKKKLPSPPWNRQEAFNPRLHAGPYDYIIVRHEKRPIFPPGTRDWRLVRREGDFTLYERVTPRPASR